MKNFCLAVACLLAFASFAMAQRVAPVDDSNKAYVTVFGDTSNATYQAMCNWGRKVAPMVRYNEISTTDPRYAQTYRNAVPNTPKMVITSPSGVVLYKGVPASETEFRSIFNRSCPNGNCRPFRDSEPAPVQPDVPAPIVDVNVEPVPDTPVDSGLGWFWYVLAGLGGAGGGTYSWWKKKYFSA